MSRSLWFWWGGSMLVIAMAACGGRSLGSSGGDAGATGCADACVPPYVCDDTRGECRCPDGTCCAMVDCFCTPVQRFCQGLDLARCDAVPVSGEDGECGSRCEYTAVEACALGCREPSFGDASCLPADPECLDRPTERYTFALVDANGTETRCDALPVGTTSHVRSLYGSLVLGPPGRFTIASAGGEGYPYTVRHDLAEATIPCLATTDKVSVEIGWVPVASGRCVETLAVIEHGAYLLYARDGDLEDLPDLRIHPHLEELSCPEPVGEGWCAPPVTYTFGVLDDPGTVVPVSQGETEEIVTQTTLDRVWVTNTRSYDSGRCGDDWNFAFHVAAAGCLDP